MSGQEVTNWISAVQAAIALFGTGVLLWYTWETRRYRITADKQLETLAQQLALERDKYFQAAEPLFDLIGGSTPVARDCLDLHLRNIGAPVSQLAVVKHAGDSFTLNARDNLTQQKDFYLRILSPNPKSLIGQPIVFEYTAGHGERRRQTYCFGDDGFVQVRNADQ